MIIGGNISRPTTHICGSELSRQCSKVTDNQIASCTLPEARSLYNNAGSSSPTPLTTSSLIPVFFYGIR